MLETVAIVGRPNVGKSSLFNRLINKRHSIVHDTPGVTRDRIYSEVTWQKSKFNVIDTGGIEVENATFQQQIKFQVSIAIEEASMIILVLDGQSDITRDDLFIANILKKTNKKIFVAINKSENNTWDQSLRRIGFPTLFPISALHGTGVGDLLDEITNNIDDSDIDDNRLTRLTIIGKPNVGKSSLLNALTQQQRSIVSSIPGTTRDSTSSTIEIMDTIYEIIDTAGIQKKSRLVEAVEHYALIRAMNSLDNSDIALLVIDASNELTKFDARIIGYALEKSKPIILIINKWDLIKKSTNTMSEYVKKLRVKFPFLSWSPVVFVSALKNQRLEALKKVVSMVDKNMNKKIKTSILNEILVDIYTLRPPKSFGGGTVIIKYITQSKGKVPTFVLFINQMRFLHFSYKRYLTNQLREHFDFTGVPIILKFIAKKNNE